MRETADMLHKALTMAMQEREKRQEPVEFPGAAPELGWIIHERLVMYGMVNLIREGSMMRPVSYEDIKRVERMATGHSDYSRKFSFYCAELALGITRSDTF